ncbi:MAG: beta-ketoacyl-ACP synthase III [bacterium]
MTVKPFPVISRIAGTGRAIPVRVLTNADLEKIVDTTDEWITSRTGIKTRYVAEPGQPLSDFAIEAGRKALEDAGMKATELDRIIVGTVTGDMKFPASSNFVQAALGADNAASFDIQAACSGFIYALEMADSLIRGGRAQNVLVIGAEILTSMVNWKDRSTCVLFGDGAGAAVVVPATGNGRGILATYTGSNGNLAHLLYSRGGGTLAPGTDRNLPPEEFTIHMAGNEVFKHAVKTMGDAAVIGLERAGLTSDDLDLMIPHQANIRIIDATVKRLNLPQEKVYINVERYGNTSSASIPIAFDEVRRGGLVKEGDVVLFVAFGGGFTWGSAVIRL